MFATQVLREDLPENVVEDSDEVDVVGFIEIREKKYEVRKGETKIGRDATVCSIVIDNFTVSKVHAVIESDGPDDTFIYDVNSTNQTKLGKKVLKPHCRYKLENNNTITLGNIIAKFTLPHDFSNKTEQKPSLDILNAPDDLEDIFEVATQVSVPHSHSTVDVPQPQKISENVHIFKVPNSMVPDIKVKTSPESLADPESRCQLDSHDLVSQDCSSADINTSSIFSLSTQCQIIEPANSENKGESVFKGGHKSDDPTNIKYLLNDGEDDVLCMFMSLHSPSEQDRNAPIAKIKTEPVEPNISQIFDVKTQAVLYHTEETNNDLADKFNEDLNYQNAPKSSTSNNKNVEINCQSTTSEISDISAEHFEEDLIATQVFTTNPKVCVGLPISDDEPQELNTCSPKKPTDSSQPEETTENEDLICTQQFKVPDNKETTCEVADELNDGNEDFLATQIYDFEKELNKKPEESKETQIPGSPEMNDSREDFVSTQIYEITKRQSDNEPVEAIKKAASFVVLESPERNTETPTRISSDFTQINAEEDFISTQMFGEITSAWNDKPGNRSPRDEDDEVDDDEDFIATQSAEALMNNIATTKSIQEPESRIQTAARESSPDLLDSGFSAKTSEDITDTVIFENPQLQSPKASLLEYSEEINSMFGNKENRKHLNIVPLKTETVESSGDETESDLEIIYDKTDKNSDRFEPKKKLSVTSEVLENSTRSVTHENDDNDSYVFHLEPEAEIEPTSVEENIQFQKERADNSDSDATDCEEIAIVGHKMSIKHEALDKATSEETEVLASTPPNNFVPFENDGWAADEPSPTFEDTSEETIEKNQSFLQKEDTENKDIVYETPAKIMRSEVGSEPFPGNSIQGKAKTQVDSPLKRPGSSRSEVDVIPTKKSKTEISGRKLRSGDKQFWKLWQAHDIEQIQPSRTRNSLNNVSKNNTGNNSNEVDTSRRKTNVRGRRKLSSDITSYLNEKVEPKRTEGRGRQIPPEENCAEAEPVDVCQRVLRSSSRNSRNRAPFEPFETFGNTSNITRRRSSRFKSDEYFRDSCVNVVFTGFDCESLENIISDLGGKITNDPSSGDVVVADKVRRTVKFLSAIGLSLPIVSPDWLVSCRAEKKFVNPWNFILKDEESEKKWNFKLKTSLNRSMKGKLMQGFSVFATENAKPPVKDLLGIVKCCGGTPLFEPPDVWPKKTVIVSCLEDRMSWPLAKCRNIKIVHYEFILSGVLTQKLDFKTYKLR